MKRASLVIAILLAVAGAGLLWKRSHDSGAKTSPEKPLEEEASRITHDETGRVVIRMSDETQGNLGLLVAKPAAAQISPELKGYGKVMDPAALAGVLGELLSAQTASLGSSNELVRLKEIGSQQKAYQRAIQTAESAALRDQLALQSVKHRLVLIWGRGIAEQPDLPAFVEALMSQSAVLVRLDLPAGETLPAPLRGARICTLSGKAAPAEFLGTTFNVDPQTLSRGATFLIKPNLSELRAGEAVTGYLELPGEPVNGALIPGDAVVRPEGRAWIYIMSSGGDAFTRTEIALDHPVDGGWLVTKGVSTNDYVVVTGAQTLLSEELKAFLKQD